MRQIPLQPHAALGQGLVLGMDLFDLLDRRVGNQRVGDFEVDLGDHLEIGVDKLVERIADGTLRRVFDRNHAVIRLALLHRGENIGNRRHAMVVDAGAELLDCGLMGVGRLGSEVGDEQRLLQRDGGRHHLAIDRAQRRIFHRSLVLRADLAQDPVLTFRHVDAAILAAFQPADLGGEGETLIEQLHQAGVEPVDLLTDSVDFHGSSG